MTESFQQHEIEVPSLPSGERLDTVLARLLPQYSRSRIAGWIRSGDVQLQGRAARPSEKVFGGEGVSLRAQLEPADDVKPEALPIDVVYADDALLIVDKPAGRVVHPGAGNREHTLQNALLAWDPALAGLPRAGLIHRIDKDTSGLLVVGRTLEAHTRLTRDLAAREIHREYVALCLGRLTGGGTVDKPIGRHRTDRLRMTVREDGPREIHREYVALCLGRLTGGGTVDKPIGRHRTDRLRMTVREDGREAVTHYRLAERFRAHTLLRVQLETGRTHQIRVHLAHLGYPLVGDPLYGGRRQLTAGASPAVREAVAAFKRQALHAARLELAHPTTGEPMTFEAPLPDDFARLLEVLRADGDA
jgi:23S rRNA pseudouridine1911/1915/1917 synthase